MNSVPTRAPLIDKLVSGKARLFMIIDFHTHIFPDSLAPRTLPHLSKIAHGIPYHTDGTQTGTLEAMRRWGVDYSVVLHIATKPGQARRINSFACEVQAAHPQFLCFGSLHPADEDAPAVAAEIAGAGLYGVKLHPAYQNFQFGDERYYPIYQAVCDCGLPLLLHAGRDPVAPGANRAPAEEIARVARAFPRLTIIAAHMGALGDCADASEHLCGLDNVYFDTAMSAPLLDPDAFRALLYKRGSDHVLFGTDCPWSTAPDELALLRRVGVTGSDLENILWKNAACLLKLAL